MAATHRLRRCFLLTVLLGLAASGCGSANSLPTAIVGAPKMHATEDDVVVSQATSSRVERSAGGPLTVLESPATLHAQVTVPDAALPEGMTADQLSAQVLSLDSPDDGLGVITFKLGPDGAEFIQPVILEWDGPWSPEALFTLSAFAGDGTPLDDPGTARANSIAALSVTRAENGTSAHYRLPIDHFSVWMVSMQVDAPAGMDPFRWTAFEIHAAADVPDTLEMGTTRGVRVTITTNVASPIVCNVGSVDTQTISGPLVVSFEDSCSPKWTESATTSGLSLLLTCNGAGQAAADTTVRSLLLHPYQPLTGSGEKMNQLSEDELRVYMLFSDNRLNAVDGGRANPILTGGGIGAMFAMPLKIRVNCTTATGTSGSEPQGSFTTTSAYAPPAAGSSATSSSSPLTGGSAPLPSSSSTSLNVPGTVVFPGWPSTSAPSTSIAPSTTAPSPSSPTSMSPTSMPPTSTPPTSISSTTTTTLVLATTTTWGEYGTWAENEYGTCSYNNSGGCGWYYDSTPGSHRQGPLGGPGSRHPSM